MMLCLFRDNRAVYWLECESAYEAERLLASFGIRIEFKQVFDAPLRHVWMRTRRIIDDKTRETKHCVAWSGTRQDRAGATLTPHACVRRTIVRVVTPLRLKRLRREFFTALDRHSKIRGKLELTWV